MQWGAVHSRWVKVARLRLDPFANLAHWLVGNRRSQPQNVCPYHDILAVQDEYQVFVDM